MHRLLWISSVVVALCPELLLATEISPDNESDIFAQHIQPLLVEHCHVCHSGPDDPAGDLDMTTIRNMDDLQSRLELVPKWIDVLESGEMPPEDEATLPAETRQQLVEYLSDVLRRALASQSTPEVAQIRRMTRFQYNNAVQDLFQLNVEVFSLPERTAREYEDYFQPATGSMPDEINVGSRPLGKSQLVEDRLVGVTPYPQDLRAEHGFDNRADHLTLSPMLLETFLRLGRSIVFSPNFNADTCGIWDEYFAPPTIDPPEDLATTVQQRIRSFLVKAFRRSASQQDVERYTAHVLTRIDTGESFTDSMKSATAAALASPRFFYLYRTSNVTDLAAPNKPDQELNKRPASTDTDDYALASRLSFFLWGSIPDETLYTLAAEGRLHEPQTLVEQTNRMLRDERVKRFCDSFPAQWLQLQRIISSFPNPEEFTEFYIEQYNASMHMMLEPLLLFETVLVEDRSLLQFIDADFSYRTTLLEHWYENGTHGPIESPYILKFKRVPVTDRRQGGMITNAAVMTMTSGNLHTKPITRGAWLATVILNDPPKPPPANVPPLNETSEETSENLTVRERFAMHRDRTDCAACHKSIDPLGFALENYNAVGVWRDTYENGQSVDPSGKLFGKHTFQDIVDFKDVLLLEKDRFTKALAAHLLEFATGREVTVRDTVALEHIVANTAAADYSMQELIRQVVLSESFRGSRKN